MLRMSIRRSLSVSFLLAVICTALPAVDKVPVLHGTARIFTLPEVTVVYPAAPAVDLESNRHSAERRAAFLKEVHGVAVEVAADDAITERQLQGNLLILGWDNRLLEHLAPILQGRRLIDGIDIEPAEHLLLYCVSPLNPASRIVVWTRIDPELDRFSVIPFQGSDWALYRNYGVVEQGNFEDVKVWPPKRNIVAEMDHRPFRSPPPVRKRSLHYNLRDTTGALSDADVEQVLAAREAAWASAVVQLGAPQADFRVELFVYADGEQKRKRSSVPDLIHSVPRHRELHMTLDLARSANPHEDLHLVARQRLGPSYSTALHEGLAIFLERPNERAELDMFAASMVERDTLPTLDQLLDEEAHRRLAKGAAGFAASGLLVGFLRSALDPDAFRRAYTVEWPTPERMAKAAGSTADELQAQFHAWIVSRGDAVQNELAFRKAEAAARERRAAGDHAAAAELYRQALEAKPDDLQTLYRLALSRMRSGEYDAAETPLRRMLELSADPEMQRFASLIHYQLGRLFDFRSDRERALEEYRAALDLPDHRDAHRRAREAMETPATPEKLH